MRLPLESRTRQPERLNPGMSRRTSVADDGVQESIIVQFDGVKSELLGPAVIDVESIIRRSSSPKMSSTTSL